MSEDGTATIRIDRETKVSIGYSCHICGAFTKIRYPAEAREICDECAARIKKLIYPEVT